MTLGDWEMPDQRSVSLKKKLLIPHDATVVKTVDDVSISKSNLRRCDAVCFCSKICACGGGVCDVRIGERVAG